MVCKELKTIRQNYGIDNSLTRTVHAVCGYTAKYKITYTAEGKTRGTINTTWKVERYVCGIHLKRYQNGQSKMKDFKVEKL